MCDTLSIKQGKLLKLNQNGIRIQLFHSRQRCGKLFKQQIDVACAVIGMINGCTLCISMHRY